MRQRSCRNSKTSFFLATKSLGTGAPKRADLSRTKGFVPTFLTKEAISLKLSDELKELACFVSKIHSRRGSTQSFPLVSKSFFASNARTKVPRSKGLEGCCKINQLLIVYTTPAYVAGVVYWVKCLCVWEVYFHCGTCVVVVHFGWNAVRC